MIAYRVEYGTLAGAGSVSVDASSIGIIEGLEGKQIHVDVDDNADEFTVNRWGRWCRIVAPYVPDDASVVSIERL